ncbi:MAG: hypothetical protein J6V90_08285 [Treponema sp.]|nr:hypothetical protein [Treponema sp.]
MNTSSAIDFDKIQKQYFQLCEAREIIALIIGEYRDKGRVECSTIERGELLLKNDVTV